MIVALLMVMVMPAPMLLSATNPAGYDSTRIYHAMARAMQGGDITIVAIGGSITAGYAASLEENRWANRVAAWWTETFPESTVNLVNAGIGGTGSDIGTHRFQTDVMEYDPDFIVVEFSVNDGSPGESAEKMMEGILRQGLQADSLPGMMILALKQKNGATAQASHKLVANHYGVPLVSYADSIDIRVARDGISLDDVFNDDVHPNDAGMMYMAEFLIEELELIHASMPDIADLPVIPADLPAPRITDVYAHCFMYKPANIIPLANAGWEMGTSHWVADEVGSEISFAIDGNAVSIIYTRDDVDSRGQVDVWIDEGAPVTLDAYFTETWGTATVFGLIEEGLDDGEHILHIKVNGNNTGGGTGHFFEILNICKAGNWTGLAPIAKAGGHSKVLINTAVALDATASFDPDGEDLTSYSWSIVSAPVGSAGAIATPDAAATEFTPDVAGHYQIGLIVGDGSYESVQSIKTINAKASNIAPVANAGEDMDLPIKVFHLLDGTASSDADGDELMYSWELVSQPGDKAPNMNFLNTVNPKVYLYDAGEYVFQLIVNDSIEASEADFLTITAVDPAVSIQSIENTSVSLHCFPNPASDLLTLVFSLSREQNISLSILDLNGKMVKSLLRERRAAGEHSLELEASAMNLGKGIYFLSLQTKSEVITTRFIFGI